MENEEKIREITNKYPTSQIRIGKDKSSYFDVISSLKYEQCNQALIRIYKRINLVKINKFIDEQAEITLLQKQIYKYLISYRYKHILEYSYEKLGVRTNEWKS